MIGYLEGKLLRKENESILLLVNQIGYEILLPTIVMDSLNSKEIGDTLSLYIYYHQTERQPKPILIGFNLEVEKEFFQYFISVEAIGPLKAVKALERPVCEIASAIEEKDVSALSLLKGIGTRTAQKIIATLEGKMGKFALIRKDEPMGTSTEEHFVTQVIDVLVAQLGHKMADAKQLVTEALKRNSAISTAEDLFEEVYRGEAAKNK